MKIYEPNAFDSIRHIVSQRTVSLLGSAPGSYFSDDFPIEYSLICANAAVLGICENRGGGGIPEITIINTAVASSPDAGKSTRELLNQVTTKLLIIVESGFPIDKARKTFESITRDATEVITLDERCKFLETFLGKPLTGRGGGQHVPSTGFFSCLVLIACGAQKIKPVGLSFSDRHSYLDKVYTRDHIQRDLDTLNFIKTKGFPVEFSLDLISSAHLINTKKAI
jgi:hypothetical protein